MEEIIEFDGKKFKFLERDIFRQKLYELDKITTVIEYYDGEKWKHFIEVKEEEK